MPTPNPPPTRFPVTEASKQAAIDILKAAAAHTRTSTIRRTLADSIRNIAALPLNRAANPHHCKTLDGPACHCQPISSNACSCNCACSRCPT